MLGLVVCLLLLVPSEGWVQNRKPMTVTEIATYNGADREQLLYAGAKTEGKVVWYTSLAGDSYKGMVKAFETKYSGVKGRSLPSLGFRHHRANDGRRQGQTLHRRYRRDHRRQPHVHARRFSVAPLSFPLFCFLSEGRQGKKTNAACTSGPSPVNPTLALLTTKLLSNLTSPVF